MEHLIKKFNLIDYLGMLIPGGIFLLVLEKDLQILSSIGPLLGEEVDASNVLWVAIFGCLSYLAGWLMHEIGSILEKIIWKSHIFNPRVYAALTTGMMEAYHTTSSCAIEKGPQIIRFIVSGILSILFLYIALGMPSVLFFSLGLVLFIVFAFVLQKNFCNKFKKYFVGNNRDQNRKKLLGILANDLEIRISSHIKNDENIRKRNLFDGYHSLARGMLTLVLILQSYVLCFSKSGNSELVAFFKTIADEPAYFLLRILFVGALVLRYWHYSCARYTYIYNGYRRSREILMSGAIVDNNS